MFWLAVLVFAAAALHAAHVQDRFHSLPPGSVTQHAGEDGLPGRARAGRDGRGWPELDARRVRGAEFLPGHEDHIGSVGQALHGGAVEQVEAPVEEDLPLRRQLPRPPGAVDEGHPEARLELVDRLAGARLGDAVLRRPPGEAVVTDHVAEDLERFELHRFSPDGKT